MIKRTRLGIPFESIYNVVHPEEILSLLESNKDYFSIEEIINWYDKLPDDIVQIERQYAVNYLGWEKIFKDLFTKEL